MNSRDPRKNIPHALRAFARLVHQERIRDLRFVLAGHAGAGWRDVGDAVERDARLNGRIVRTGYVEDEDLAPLYSGALALVYPSLYEGFGLPPLEAMQCGTPVITSNTSSLPEVVGDAALLVAPTDGDGLCQAIWDVYRLRCLREEMRRKSLARAAQFSWKRSAQQTLAAYRAAIG